MKKLLFLIVILLLYGCVIPQNDQAILPNNLLACKVSADSISIKIRLGESNIIQTDKGNLYISLLKVADACTQSECKTCDVLANVIFELKLDKETKQLAGISIGRCGNTPLPLIMKYNNLCTYPKTEVGILGLTSFGNLIFAIRELSPYPKDLEEAKLLLNEKKYEVNLIIKNRCN